MMPLVEQNERVAGRNALHGGPSSAIVAATPAVLQRIRHPDTALAIWRRNLADQIEAELATLVPDAIHDIRIGHEAETLDEPLADAMEEAGYPDLPALRRDIAMLACRHAAIGGDPRVRIRLEVIETDACRKFHADYVKMRTITTYLGQGTQWIEAASGEEAGRPGGPGIEQLDPGSVAMFKGRLWQENPTILHRSPPIGGSGERRLVLVIDPVPVEEEMAIRPGAIRAVSGHQAPGPR